MSQHLTIRKDLPSGTIIINRPERQNALSTQVVQELQQAIEDFHGERQVKGVILTGSGNAFCSGSDLVEIHRSFDSTESEHLWHEQVSQLKQLLESMLRFPKPIVAAINGWTTGSGLALMLACDTAVAGKSSHFALPEARRGLVAGLSAPLLAFRLGAGRTINLMLSGLAISADEAVRIGLVSEAVGDELVWARAQEIVSTYDQCASSSHQMSKQLMNESIGETLLTQLSIGAANTAAARSTDAAREGVTAFVEKRAPRWD